MSNGKKKKLMVLGASGFIGRNMAEYFASFDEYEVFGSYFRSQPWQHEAVTMVQADLTQRVDVDRVLAQMDIVIIAAAVTSGVRDIVNNPHVHITDTAVMNSLIFRSAFEHSIEHVIFFSCSIFYQNSEKPLKETDLDSNVPMEPHYFGSAWNKLYFEKMCEFFSRQGRNKYTVLRHSNIYGPHDKFDLEKSHVFGATMTKVMTADQENLVVWGKGEEARDLLYISDLLRFVELALIRTLQHKPAVLLLDEPTANVDDTSLHLIEDVVTQFQKENDTPVIWVSHNEEQVRRIGDKHWHIVLGRLTEVG